MSRKKKEVGCAENPEYAQMMEMYAGTFKDISEGGIVKGTVVEVRPKEVLVNIGYKSEGVLPSDEFEDLSAVQVGDELEVLLEKLEDENGMVVLSKTKAERQRNWDNVLTNCEEGAVVSGLVKGKVKGGLVIDVGVDAFLPGSQIDVVPVRNLDDYLGQTLECKVIKINKDRRNIVLSRRDLIEEKRKEQKKALLAEIQPGQIRKGVVKNITDFGAFVDLNGMDGLLHITDMSWGRINHPSEVVQVGQELEVVVLDVNQEKERISLGLKQKLQNPWDEIEMKYPKGTRIRGKVVNLVPYGAFVQLEEGVEGLVHVSEISWTKRVARASDVLSVGDEVEAVVLNVNKDEANKWADLIKFDAGDPIANNGASYEDEAAALASIGGTSINDKIVEFSVGGDKGKTPGFAGEEAEKLWDSDNTTKYCSTYVPETSIIEMDGTYGLNGIVMSTANDNSSNPGRNPDNWAILGSNDLENWTVLVNGNDTFFEDVDYTYYAASFDMTGGYKYFAFENMSTKSGTFSSPRSSSAAPLPSAS